MLIIVVIIFLLCQLPQAITHLYIVYLSVTESIDNRVCIDLHSDNYLLGFGVLLYMGCSDVSEFEHIYGQILMTPSCVYDKLFI